MKIIKGSRGIGKTTQLIKESYMSDAKILATTPFEARLLKEKAIDMGIKIPEPITIAEVLQGCNDGLNKRDLLIDDIERVLSYLLKSEIKYVTTSCSIIDFDKLRIIL